MPTPFFPALVDTGNRGLPSRATSKLGAIVLNSGPSDKSSSTVTNDRVYEVVLAGLKGSCMSDMCGDGLYLFCLSTTSPNWSRVP